MSKVKIYETQNSLTIMGRSPGLEHGQLTATPKSKPSPPLDREKLLLTDEEQEKLLNDWLPRTDKNFRQILEAVAKAQLAKVMGRGK